MPLARPVPRRDAGGELRADPAQERAVARLNALAKALAVKPGWFRKPAPLAGFTSGVMSAAARPC